MIKFTRFENGEPVYINPVHVVSILVGADGSTLIQCVSGRTHAVEEKIELTFRALRDPTFTST